MNENKRKLLIENRVLVIILLALQIALLYWLSLGQASFLLLGIAFAL